MTLTCFVFRMVCNVYMFTLCFLVISPAFLSSTRSPKTCKFWIWCWLDSISTKGRSVCARGTFLDEVNKWTNNRRQTNYFSLFFRMHHLEWSCWKSEVWMFLFFFSGDIQFFSWYSDSRPHPHALTRTKSFQVNLAISSSNGLSVPFGKVPIKARRDKVRTQSCKVRHTFCRLSTPPLPSHIQSAGDHVWYTHLKLAQRHYWLVPYNLVGIFRAKQ